MSDVNRYREGYEAELAEMAEQEDQSLAERFVKGLFSLPVDAVKDVFRNDDEAKGRRDAGSGRDFNPGD
jgi:hypothetical protein